MNQILGLLNFKSSKERDDFIIAILVLLFFAWLMWWMYPKFMANSNALPDLPNETSAIAAVDLDKDSDDDGIPDHKDNCKMIPGIAPTGCPADSDGDGVYDKEDKCPHLKGQSYNEGCPADTDGDGIYDKDDKCPKLAGTLETDGCPLDSDGDGVYDDDDKCPNKVGDASNGGCPKIKLDEEETKIMAESIKNIEFETGKATLKRTSNTALHKVKKILEKYPDYKLEINGHTDNQGDADNNLQLSKDRAKSCYDYFVQKGISTERLIYNGYGDQKPLLSNDTEEGRKANRRVEFKLRY